MAHNTWVCEQTNIFIWRITTQQCKSNKLLKYSKKWMNLKKKNFYFLFFCLEEATYKLPDIKSTFSWFNLYEIQEHTRLVYGGRNQNNDCLWKGSRENFLRKWKCSTTWLRLWLHGFMHLSTKICVNQCASIIICKSKITPKETNKIW